jgi:hypothetical protein
MTNQENAAAEHPAGPSRSRTDMPQIIVVDFGKAQRKKQVKRLRKGQGKLMARVKSLVSELVEAGTVPATTQPLVIVVRERAELAWPFGG